MTTKGHITTSIVVWVVATAVAFFFVFPKLANQLVVVQQSHQTQIDEDNRLRTQIQALNNMQTELDKLRKQPVQPSDLFTPDVQLVNEIQHIEDVGQATNNGLTISISGTVKGLQQYPSQSGLLQVPYNIGLKGSFPGTVAFLKYLENSYFVSPINGFSIGAVTGGVNTNILTNFFINQQAAANQTTK